MTRKYNRKDSLGAFANAYIEAALWSSTDNADDSGGEPLDKNYSASDIADATIDKMIADCDDFEERFGSLIHDDDSARLEQYGRSEVAGHDFWLTRNRHGAGFEDGDWPKHGDELAEAARSYGEFDLYVGDDGEIHGTPLDSPGVREAGHYVADFNTLDDLLEHARKEGATHVLHIDDEIHLYFKRRDGKYEKAEVWQKDGYWHTQAPGSRAVVPRPPQNAKPIGSHSRRGAAEAHREIEHELWLCQDCMIAEVNGDYSGMSEERAEEVAIGIERLVERVGPLSANFDENEGEEEFSRRRCDACGSNLAGSHFRFASFGKTRETRETREAPTKAGRNYVNGWNHVEKGIQVWVSGDEPTRVSITSSRANDKGRAFASEAVNAWWGSPLHLAWTDTVNADISRDYTHPSNMRPRGGVREPHSVHDYIAVDKNDRRVAGPFKHRHEADQHVPPGGHVKFTTAHRRGAPSPAPSAYPMFRESSSKINFGPGDRVRIRVIGPQGQLADPPFWYTIDYQIDLEELALQFSQNIQPGMFVSISDGKNSWTFKKETTGGQNTVRRTHKLPTGRYRESKEAGGRARRPKARAKRSR